MLQRRYNAQIFFEEIFGVVVQKIYELVKNAEKGEYRGWILDNKHSYCTIGVTTSSECGYIFFGDTFGAVMHII